MIRYLTQAILAVLLLFTMVITMGGHAADPGVAPCPAVGECW